MRTRAKSAKFQNVPFKLDNRKKIYLFVIWLDNAKENYVKE